MVTPADLSSLSVHSTRTSLSSGLSTSGIPQLTYDGHTATSNASDNSQRFQETCFAFALTPQQVQQISSSMDISGTKCDFTVQVQLRFCLSETSCPQEDHFPPNLCVKVNGKPCNLPGYLPPTKNGVEPKRPSRPINITSLNYSLAVYLVKQQSSAVLLQRLRSKGIRNPDHSRALSACRSTLSEHRQNLHNSMKVEVIDLTLDSSSDEDEDDEPPAKRSCTSLSPASPPISKGVLNLHHQASPGPRTPSMSTVDSSYIPPPPPLIQDYRHSYHTLPYELQGKLLQLLALL
ncbi:UNVERIFIED_CONTAM: hypothetical protein FKN15_052891 [Acipenser sinensis]